MKKLTRSVYDRKLAGVLGGLGEYFGVDPTILRIIFIILLVTTAFIVPAIIYLLMVLVVPNEEGV